MNEERIYQIIQGAHISEKSTRIADNHRQFVFKVISDANKIEIRQAVESLFKVEVEKVSTLRVKGKRKIFRGVKGTKKGWKKAYVSLKEGYDIDFVTQS